MFKLKIHTYFKVLCCVIIIITFNTTKKLYAQQKNKYCTKSFFVTNDTLQPDTLFVFDLKMYDSVNNLINPDLYFFDTTRNLIIFKNYAPARVRAEYNTFPLSINNLYYNRSKNELVPELPDYTKKSLNTENEKTETDFSQIIKTGEFSRGVIAGNRNDLVLKSEMDILLDGKLTDDVTVEGRIADNNSPVQADGSTFKIEEFDMLYIRVNAKMFSFTAGDYTTSLKQNKYLNFEKRMRGLDFSNRTENNKIAGSSGIAVSKGKFVRNELKIISGVAGPYKLTGANGENFIIILSGSERVLLNGQYLTRGSENDYIIDYNAGEITFTTKRILNNYDRVVVEFEYSERSFSRVAFFTNQTVQFNNGWINAGYFSETDLKNQSLQQQLTAEQIKLLKNQKPGVNNVLLYIADTVPAGTQGTTYRKTDTLVSGISYSNVFVALPYSTGEILYNPKFTFTGTNNGNYVLVPTPNNQRVFKWIAPVNGKMQGNYEPAIRLITPQSNKIVAVSGMVGISENHKILFSAAHSNNSANTFLPASANNKGYAFCFTDSVFLPQKNNKQNWHILLGVEKISKFFKPENPLFDAEFYRNRNLTPDYNSDLLSVSAQVFTLRKSKWQVQNMLNYLHLSSIKYSALCTNTNFETFYQRFNLKTSVSYMQSADSAYRTQFIKNNTALHINTKLFIFKIYNLTEHNKLNSNHTNNVTGFFNNTVGVSITNTDSAAYAFGVTGCLRTDALPANGTIDPVSQNRDIGLFFNQNPKKNHRMQISLNYKDIKPAHTKYADTITEQKFLNSQVELNNRFGNYFNIRTVAGQTTRRDPLREFAFYEVEQGRGLFKWNDYNQNNIKELNEFEPAVFPTDADFVKIALPNTKYTIVSNIFISADFICTPFAGLQNTNLQQSNFYGNFFKDFSSTDSSNTKTLYKAGFLLKPTHFLHFSAVYNTQNLTVLNFYGLDKNNIIQYLLNITFVTPNNTYLSLITEQNRNKQTSGFFENKNFNLVKNNYKCEITSKIAENAESKLFAEYFEITNNAQQQKSFNTAIGFVLNYTDMPKQNIMAEYKFLNIRFRGTTQNTAAYNMLQGFNPGKNHYAAFTYTRNLNKIINIVFSYNLIISANKNVNQWGGIEIRSQF